MSRELGFAAEKLAEEFLVNQGFVCLAQHYRSRHGEIDLIMQDSFYQDIVFVEVKYRKYLYFGAPYEAVNKQKQRKLYLTALHFLTYKLKDMNLHARFDVMSIAGSKPEINWIKNAFVVS